MKKFTVTWVNDKRTELKIFLLKENKGPTNYYHINFTLL